MYGSIDCFRCNCQLVLVQVIVYALRICAVMLQKSRQSSECYFFFNTIAMMRYIQKTASLEVCACGSRAGASGFESRPEQVSGSGLVVFLRSWTLLAILSRKDDAKASFNFLDTSSTLSRGRKYICFGSECDCACVCNCCIFDLGEILVGS